MELIKNLKDKCHLLAVLALPSDPRWRKGSCGSLILPQGPYGSVQDRYRRLKRLAIARWPRHMGMPSRHKGWAGSITHPTHVCFPFQHTTPSKVMPHRLTPSVASGRPLTGLGRMRGRGSSSHLMRAFTGSKPLLIALPTASAYLVHRPLS